MNAARQFCTFIETEDKLTKTEFLRLTETHLVTLYSYGRHLPSVHLQVNKDYESAIEDSVMKALLKSIGNRVPISYYWVVLNPVDINNSAETGTGDLIDDLGDIYRDLKCALIVFDIEDSTAKENAIWTFKFDFDYHWKEHCIEALSAIHHYLAESK